MSGDRDRILESHNVNIVGNAASDRTLVFSHGFGADQTEWDSIVPGLADEYRCVLLDHAGAGRSQPDTYDTRRHSRMHGHAEDLVAIVEALGLKGCTVVAHSAGGIIALLAAADRPELFSRMVLIGSSARYQDDDGYRGGFTRDDLIGLYRLMMTDYQTWLTQFTSLVTGKPEGNVLRVYLMHLLNSLGPDRALAMARTVLESDIREWLPLVSHPTLLLQARADPIVPHAAAEYLHRSLAGSQLQVLPADGHFAFLDVPDVVAAAIREFAAT